MVARNMQIKITTINSCWRYCIFIFGTSMNVNVAKVSSITRLMYEVYTCNIYIWRLPNNPSHFSRKYSTRNYLCVYIHNYIIALLVRQSLSTVGNFIYIIYIMMSIKVSNSLYVNSIGITSPCGLWSSGISTNMQIPASFFTYLRY